MRRRWLDFRNGHSTYLVFIMGFTQFVVLTYQLVIKDVSTIKSIFPNMWEYGIIFVIGYIPFAMLIGHWHLKRQYPVDAERSVEHNPYNYKAVAGKERDFNMPLSILQMDIQLKQMETMNEMSKLMKLIPPHPEEHFIRLRNYQAIAQKLARGDTI